MVWGGAGQALSEARVVFLRGANSKPPQTVIRRVFLPGQPDRLTDRSYTQVRSVPNSESGAVGVGVGVGGAHVLPGLDDELVPSVEDCVAGSLLQDEPRERQEVDQSGSERLSPKVRICKGSLT